MLCMMIAIALATVGLTITRHTISIFNRDCSAHLGILKSALIGFSPKRGGVLSATSMAVMPNDHTSALAS
jgi:hypothetical protein